MLRKGTYAVYQGVEYEFHTDMNSSDWCIHSNDPEMRKQGFVPNRYGGDSLEKVVRSSDLEDLYRINFYVVINDKRRVFVCKVTEDRVLLFTSGSIYALEKYNFVQVDKYGYEAWVDRSEIQLLECWEDKTYEYGVKKKMRTEVQKDQYGNIVPRRGVYAWYGKNQYRIIKDQDGDLWLYTNDEKLIDQSFEICQDGPGIYTRKVRPDELDAVYHVETVAQIKWEYDCIYQPILLMREDKVLRELTVREKQWYDRDKLYQQEEQLRQEKLIQQETSLRKKWMTKLVRSAWWKKWSARLLPDADAEEKTQKDPFSQYASVMRDGEEHYGKWVSRGDIQVIEDRIDVSEEYGVKNIYP